MLISRPLSRFTIQHLRFNTHNTHRAFSSSPIRNMKISPIAVSWSDNWMYLVVDDATKNAVVVDPYDPKTIIGEIGKADVTVSVYPDISESGVWGI